MNSLRAAARLLRRAPGFSFTAVTTLGLGIALVGTVTAVINAYLIRSLPVPYADRLYHVIYAAPGQPEPRGLADLDWRTLGDVADMADQSYTGTLYITDQRYTLPVSGLISARSSFTDIGVKAVIGRSFRDEDFLNGGEEVALIGQGLWRERFGGDSAVIGRQFRAYASNPSAPTEIFRVIGVLPAGFRYIRGYERGDVDIAVPMRVRARQVYLVRLRAGVPPELAERRITEEATKATSAAPRTWHVRLESVHERYVAGLRPALRSVGIVSVLVLTIIVVNLGVLVLLRIATRQPELAVRIALGATRGQLLCLVGSATVHDVR